MNIEQQLLRQFLAALAYRTQKALRDAPAGFSEFRAGNNARTPHELVWHMTGVIGYALTLFTSGEWHPERLGTFEAEVHRFHSLLEDLALCLESGNPLPTTTYERLLQGPFADAMTHVGQLAMLRRLAGAPIPPENFLLADIRPENLTADQPLPVAPKPGWTPDQSPPSPGKRTQNVYSTIEAANRYNTARSLRPETRTLWLEALKAAVPKQEIRKLLDLGCGTGRFTVGLSEAFASAVVGIEPSAAMLDVARQQVSPNIEWKQGGAENIPLESQAVDLVFMSQVFHHLTEPHSALREINRVLTPAGYLIVRNGTREHNGELSWLDCFPDAREIEDKRTPSSQELKELVCSESFVLLSHRTIYQLFASSYDEYLEKIGQRGLSALIMISDESFQGGLRRLQTRVSEQPRKLPVYEPVDLFVFQKISIK